MADTTISSLNTVNALSANNFIPISDGITTTKLGTDSLFGFRNRLINGDMRIDQRNNGTVVSLSAVTVNYPVDRWTVWNLTDGTCNIQRSNDAPPGFTNSTSITITSPDTSLIPGQYLVFWSRNEGNMFSDFKLGTQNAKTFTLSFWVKCSLAGVFGGAIRNSNSAFRGYPFNFNINSINTWEYKTITIPGDTTGTWLKDNNDWGFDVLFSLGTGSTFTGTAGSWVASNVINATGSTSVVGVNGATFNITGIQIELGSTASPFEFRPIGMELAMCQRYYQLHGNGVNGNSSGSTTVFEGGVVFPVEMRRVPDFSLKNTSIRMYAGGGYDNTATASIIGNQSTTSKGSVIQLNGWPASSTYDQRGARLLTDNCLAFNAEL
jgi:hypothetical protein